MIKVKGVKDDIEVTPHMERQLEKSAKQSALVSKITSVLLTCIIFLSILQMYSTRFDTLIACFIIAMDLLIIMIHLMHNEHTRDIFKQSLIKEERYQEAKNIKVAYNKYDIAIICFVVFQIVMQVLILSL